MNTDALYGKPKVGGDALSYCGKCKLELAHVVVAIVDNLPVKVTCKTCKTTHRYRAKAATPRVAGAKKLPKKPSAGSIEVLWEKKMAERKSKAHLNYSPKEKFEMGDCVIHTQFGLGLVEEVKGNTNKIVVLFREGERVLVHGLA